MKLANAPRRTVWSLLLMSHALPASGLVGDLLFRDGFEPTAQISILPTPAFPPQLVATASAPLVVTITNVGGITLAINEIGNSGANASDFVLDLGATQFTLAPTDSTTLNITFKPAEPWQPGTRQAQLELIGNVPGGVAYAAESGQGATCGGAVPACSSGCADSDGDGLNDAWEIAGGIDVNNDGVIDAQHDVPLPGADPDKPDIYVKYDYMVATTTSSIGTPPHSHQPPDAAIQQVVDAFATHGVNLHIDPQHDAIDEVAVTTLDPNPAMACAGSEFVTMQTLRQQHLGNRKWAYHYGVFAHNAVLPDTATDGYSCPQDAECLAYPDPSNSGSSDLPGSSFIVAFGYDVDVGNIIGIETWAGTFMHELGHNFGLKHGSVAAPAPQTCIAFKPNYLSVMDYLYQSSGIATAAEPGSAVPSTCSSDADCAAGSHCTDDFLANVCYRVDYSREKLLDLNEASLDEPLGVGGPAGDTDTVAYCSSGVGCTLRGPSHGPIDWNNDGDATETNAQGDIDGDNGLPNTALQTGNDWELTSGALPNLNFKFQCTSAFAHGGEALSTGGLVESSITTPELGRRYARQHHILYPPAAASLMFDPGCSNPSLPRHSPDVAQLALLGSAAFDVSQVEFSSLRLHGAHPVNISRRDVNYDGIPDLLLEFHSADAQISPRATHLRLSGWLKNSRAFVGETEMADRCSP